MKYIAYLTIIFMIFSCTEKDPVIGEHNYIYAKKFEDKNIFGEKEGKEVGALYFESYPKIEYNKYKKIIFDVESKDNNVYKGNLYLIYYKCGNITKRQSELDSSILRIESYETIGDTIKFYVFNEKELLAKNYLIKDDNGYLLSFDKKDKIIGSYEDFEKEEYIFYEDENNIILKPFFGNYKDVFNKYIDKQIEDIGKKSSKEAEKKADIEYLERLKV